MEKSNRVEKGRKLAKEGEREKDSQMEKCEIAVHHLRNRGSYNIIFLTQSKFFSAQKLGYVSPSLVMPSSHSSSPEYLFQFPSNIIHRNSQEFISLALSLSFFSSQLSSIPLYVTHLPTCGKSIFLPINFKSFQKSIKPASVLQMVKINMSYSDSQVVGSILDRKVGIF